MKCIIDDKKILLLDEPTNNLDVKVKDILLNILKNIKDKTMIVITHDKQLSEEDDYKQIKSTMPQAEDSNYDPI